ncbi:MAG: hypothetical protein ACLFV7_10390 [Phycisphaerae bacterium]
MEALTVPAFTLLQSALLDALQRGVPLRRRPWDEIAADLHADPAWVCRQIDQWKQDGLLREVSGIFSAAQMGYRTALVAVASAPGRRDAAGEFAAGHPGVSHCYGRRHERYDLWFTLATSPHSRLGLERSAELIARHTGSEGPMVLPTLKRYKLRVHLGPASAAGTSAGNPQDTRNDPGDCEPVQPCDLPAIEALQQDLPLIEEPFALLADRVAMTPNDLLAAAERFRRRGWLRRYAAGVSHRLAGARANVLAVWEVSDAEADKAGEVFAAEPAVSHCYLRPAGPDWPYRLYTMVHAADPEEAGETIARMRAAADTGRHVLLATEREYAKRRVRLFTPAEAQWEDRWDR